MMAANRKDEVKKPAALVLRRVLSCWAKKSMLIPLVAAEVTRLKLFQEPRAETPDLKSVRAPHIGCYM